MCGNWRWLIAYKNSTFPNDGRLAVDDSTVFSKIYFTTMPMVVKNPDVTHVENGPGESNHLAYQEPLLQKQVVRKLDWNLMPLILVLCTFCLLFTYMRE